MNALQFIPTSIRNVSDANFHLSMMRRPITVSIVLKIFSSTLIRKNAKAALSKLLCLMESPALNALSLDFGIQRARAAKNVLLELTTMKIGSYALNVLKEPNTILRAINALNLSQYALKIKF